MIAIKPVLLIPPRVMALRPLAQLRRANLPKSSNIAKLDPVKSLLLLVELAKARRWEDFGFVEQDIETIPVEAAQIIIPCLLKDGHAQIAQEIYDKITFSQAKKKKKGPIIFTGPQRDLRTAIKQAGKGQKELSPIDFFDQLVAGAISFETFIQSLPVSFKESDLVKLVTRQRFTPDVYCFLRKTAFCERALNLTGRFKSLSNSERFEAWRYYQTARLLRVMISYAYERAAQGRLNDQAGQAIFDLIMSDEEFEFLPPAETLPRLIARGRQELRKTVKGMAPDEDFSVTEETPAALFVCAFVLEPQAKALQLRKEGRFEEAMFLYTQLEEVIPEAPDLLQDTVTCLYEWAAALHAIDGQTRRPLELMQQAYALTPDHVGVQGVLSYFYCLEDEYKPAIPILTKLIADQEKLHSQLTAKLASAPQVAAIAKPNVQPGTQIVFGTFVSQRNAVERQLEELNKGYADSLTSLGHCFYLKHLETQEAADLDRAEELLIQAAKLSDSPYTAFCSALVYAFKGDFDKSRSYLNQRLRSAHPSLAFMSYLEKIIGRVDLEGFNEEGFLELARTIDASDMNRSRCSKASSLIDKLLDTGLTRLPIVLLSWMNQAVETKGEDLGENDFLGGEVRLDTEVDALIISALNKMDPQLALENCQRRLALRPSKLLINTLGGIHLEQARYQEAVEALERAVNSEDMPHLLLPLITMLEAYRKMESDNNYKRTLRRLYNGIEAAIKAGVVGQFRYMSYYRVLFEEEKRILAERPNFRPAVQRVLTLLEQNFAEQYAKARATFDSPSI